MNEQQYLLQCLAEEAAEVSERLAQLAVRALKASRFGMEEIQPPTPSLPSGHTKTNRQRIQEVLDLTKEEWADMTSVARLLGFLVEIFPDALKAKEAKIAKYRKYSQDLGLCD